MIAAMMLWKWVILWSPSLSCHHHGPCWSSSISHKLPFDLPNYCNGTTSLRKIKKPVQRCSLCRQGAAIASYHKFLFPQPNGPGSARTQAVYFYMNKYTTRSLYCFFWLVTALQNLRLLSSPTFPTWDSFKMDMSRDELWLLQAKPGLWHSVTALPHCPTTWTHNRSHTPSLCSDIQHNGMEVKFHWHPQDSHLNSLNVGMLFVGLGEKIAHMSLSLPCLSKGKGN